jgi:hypothetical protein
MHLRVSCLLPLLSLLSALFHIISLTFLTFVGLNDDQMHSSNDYICSDYDYAECLLLLADNPITNLFFCVASRMLPFLLSTGTDLIMFGILIWGYHFFSVL